MPATQSNFILTLARPVVTPSGEHPHLVHLAWRTAAAETSRLVQAYLDGRLAAVTREPSQRELWLVCDRAMPHRVELLAVDPDDAWRPRPELLVSWSPPVCGELDIAVMRDAQLPIDTRVTLEIDGQPRDVAELFPAGEPRPGFGGLLGVGEFGRDDPSSPGLGAPTSELGAGPLGSDGSALRFHRDGLPPGEHAVQLLSNDRQGLAVAGPLTLDPVTIDAPPSPASTFDISSDFAATWL